MLSSSVPPVIPAQIRVMVLPEGPGSGPARLSLQSCPQPGPGEVLVRLEAISLSTPRPISGGGLAVSGLPVPGGVAGVIAGCGPGMVMRGKGQAVFGWAAAECPRSVPEYCVVDSRLIAPIPAGLGWRRAAALPLAFVTAWQALAEGCAVGPETSVLILDGSGAIGTVAVQVARLRRARVFAIPMEAPQFRLLKRLGAVPLPADMAANRILARFTGGTGFHVVFDTTGRQSLSVALGLVRSGGVVLTVRPVTVADLVLAGRRQVTVQPVPLFPEVGGGQCPGVDRLGRLIALSGALSANGRVLPHVDPLVFSQVALRGACDYVAAGHAVGKVVVDGFPTE